MMGDWAGRTGGMHWLVWVRTGGENTYFENWNALNDGISEYLILEHGSLKPEPRHLLGWSCLGEMAGSHDDACDVVRQFFRRAYHLPKTGNIGDGHDRQAEKSTKIKYAELSSFGGYDPKSTRKNCQCMVIDLDLYLFDGANQHWLMEPHTDYEGRDESPHRNWESNAVERVGAHISTTVADNFTRDPVGSTLKVAAFGLIGGGWLW